MQIIDGFSSSLQSIFSHKLRSFLTLIGITIGVGAVVAMFSSVDGLQKMIQANMEKFGWNNSIIVRPGDPSEQSGSRRRRGYRYWHRSRELKPLTYEDFQVLSQLDLDYKYMYGSIDLWSQLVTADNQKWVNLFATSRDFFEAKTYPILKGRFYNSYETRTAAKVCVVGPHFADKYLKTDDPVGMTITLGDYRYKIIGMLDYDVIQRTKIMGGGNQWEREFDLTKVYIPLSTGARYLQKDNAIHFIYFQAHDPASFARMKTTVQQTLLAQHSMTHDFVFDDIGSFMLEVTQEINKFMRKWNITLSAIASVSLLVGGIGLFSTLLISINEKMLEIGIRKSVGATGADIFVYFLIEAITLALMGAIVGILLAKGLSMMMGRLLEVDFILPVKGVMLGLGFALGIGILSGIYPAWRASRVDPVQAIFYFE